MKSLILALCAVFAFGEVRAQTYVWQPSPGHTQLPIWPGAAPDAHAQLVRGPEYADCVSVPFRASLAARRSALRYMSRLLSVVGCCVVASVWLATVSCYGQPQQMISKPIT